MEKSQLDSITASMPGIGVTAMDHLGERGHTSIVYVHTMVIGRNDSGDISLFKIVCVRGTFLMYYVCIYYSTVHVLHGYSIDVIILIRKLRV